MVAAAEPIAQFMGEPEVAGMVAAGGLTFALYSLGSASQAVYMREMKFRTIELRTWLALVIGSVAAIIAASIGAGPWALALQQILFASTFVAALWFRAGWRPTLEFSRPVFRELASFAIRIAGGRWARFIELLVLTLLIGRLASVAELGAWTFGMSMVILPTEPDRPSDRRGALLRVLPPPERARADGRPLARQHRRTWRQSCCRSCSA